MSGTVSTLWCINVLLLALVFYKIYYREPEQVHIRVVHPFNISQSNATHEEEDLDSVKDLKKLLLSYVKARRQLAAPYLPPSMLIISGTQRILLDTGNSTLEPMIWYRYESAYNTFLELESITYHQKSAFQEVTIGQVARGGGTIISSDGDTQAYQNDEQIYHEYLAITPLLYHAMPKRALVVGGGDMLALTQLIKDTRIEEIVLVDIDPVIVEASQKFLTNVNKYSWHDKRVKILILDGLKYLAETKDRYDIVIVDLLDAWTEKAVLLWAKVLELCERVMKKDAILSSHSSSDAPLHLLHRVYLICQHYFSFVVMHKHVIRSFGNWGFLLASRTVDFEEYSAKKLRYRFDLINNGTEANADQEQIIKFVVPERYPSSYELDESDEAAISTILADIEAIQKKEEAAKLKKQAQAKNTTIVETK